MSGRREEQKEAVRAALRDSARRLFAERGYERTTVRQIARGAGVTERTLYRHFGGKEGLLAEQALGELHLLGEAIRARPTEEPPLVAVRRALSGQIGSRAAATGPGALWVFGRAETRQALRQATPRPLLRLEGTIAGAILERLEAVDAAPAGERASRLMFEAQLTARLGVAALRSAVIRRRELGDTGRPPSVEQLLDEAFDLLAKTAGEL